MGVGGNSEKKPGDHLEKAVIIQVGEDVGLARDHRGKEMRRRPDSSFSSQLTI